MEQLEDILFTQKVKSYWPNAKDEWVLEERTNGGLDFIVDELHTKTHNNTTPCKDSDEVMAKLRMMEGEETIDGHTNRWSPFICFGNSKSGELLLLQGLTCKTKDDVYPTLWFRIAIPFVSECKNSAWRNGKKLETRFALITIDNLLQNGPASFIMNEYDDMLEAKAFFRAILAELPGFCETIIADFHKKLHPDNWWSK